ncbi:hypothetical protein L6452_14522 [Arctium lappa]|uniref:Uncharacterized protein n=1 Tax=Arctium lappa TaxID=4217 RepID=A0ACB9CLA0_ARCLA|nr:hypothetical protein L6452_14522 [Arctium lappa]
MASSARSTKDSIITVKQQHQTGDSIITVKHENKTRDSIITVKKQQHQTGDSFINVKVVPLTNRHRGHVFRVKRDKPLQQLMKRIDDDNNKTANDIGLKDGDSIHVLLCTNW